MRLEYAITVLERELAELSKPLGDNEEEDIYSAVLNFRDATDIKVALKILKECLENSKLIN